MDFTGNLSGAVSALPTEIAAVLQPLIVQLDTEMNGLMDRITVLEAKAAKDEQAIVASILAGVTEPLAQANDTLSKLAAAVEVLLEQGISIGVRK